MYTLEEIEQLIKDAETRSKMDLTPVKDYLHELEEENSRYELENWELSQALDEAKEKIDRLYQNYGLF